MIYLKVHSFVARREKLVKSESYTMGKYLIVTWIVMCGIAIPGFVILFFIHPLLLYPLLPRQIIGVLLGYAITVACLVFPIFSYLRFMKKKGEGNQANVVESKDGG